MPSGASCACSSSDMSCGAQKHVASTACAMELNCWLSWRLLRRRRAVDSAVTAWGCNVSNQTKSAERIAARSYISCRLRLIRVGKAAALCSVIEAFHLSMAPNSDRSRNQPTSTRTVKEPWHAVSVVSGPEACAPALALRGKRLLSSDAPRLPLTNCSRPGKCGCIYRHYRDRRATPRRASDRGMAATAVLRERREVRGRRSDDFIS